MRVMAIGWRAHAALTASAGLARVIAALSGSFYAEAAGELVWVGPPGTPLHARAVVASGVTPLTAGALTSIMLNGVTPWRPVALSKPLPDGSDAAGTLRAILPALGEPRGLGVLLGVDAADDPITARARPHVGRLAEASATNDSWAVVQSARPLLGLGSGLTPSGDDFVGGLLFARRLIVTAATWETTVARIVADAATLTHPISARLLADLAAGEGWAPLHDLALSLAASETDTAVAAARHIIALGHSSGWDLLTGLLMGLLGSADLPT